MSDRSLALVTGAARGIGLAAAQALAEDGHQLILADIYGEGLDAAVSSVGNGARGRQCDVGNADEVHSLFDWIGAECGPLSALVNNAGITLSGEFLSYSLEDFRRVIDVNLTSAFIATQRVAKMMIENGIEGAIVNMSSINAKVAIPSIPAYCCSKGGVMQLTKSAALALAPHNIRVNAIGPGSIDTAMLTSVNTDPGALGKMMSRTPLKRIGTAREVGDLIAFLASPKASYITGETIYIDGGRLALNYTC